MTTMSHQLTRRNISALAKLDFADLGHAQRIDAIAKALGYNTGAALMGSLKRSEDSAEASPGTKHRAIYAFGSTLSSQVEFFEDILDKNGDISGDLTLVEFDTVEELAAYDQGVADANGWMDCTCFATKGDSKDYGVFDILENEPDVVKAYTAARRKYMEQDDDPA
jgi:hypothetical protein